LGVPSLTLMENAGSAVARFVLSRYPRAHRFTIVCGKGNNGGDGFVIARKLGHEGKRVVLVLLANPVELKGDAAEMFRQMKLDPVVITAAEQLNAQPMAIAMSADVIIDAILGTGFKPPVQGLYAEAIGKINSARKPVVAVDIPSGADADAFSGTECLRVRADHVVTFTAPRPAHIFENLTRGETLITPIGSPEEAIRSNLNLELITPRDFAVLLRDREPDGHKGIYGHALVVGGSFGKCGAAAMAGVAVLRTGAGLSTIATPKSVLNTVAGFAPELMTEALDETADGTISPAVLGARMNEVMKGIDVVAIGPGVSRQEQTVEFVRSFVEQCEIPLVVDADGLNAFEGCAEKLNGGRRPLVLTPHPGEMSRLTGISTAEIQRDRIGIARRFASEHQCILVLKGHRTLVALPDGMVWVNTTGNPGMATGGSGDVLTGMVAGMMAQTHSMKNHDRWARAVIAAVYLHGLAGDAARDKMGEASLIAGDINSALPEAFRRAKQQAMMKSFSFSDGPTVPSKATARGHGATHGAPSHGSSPHSSPH
jgi:ADP-dependent NAD(P)H-hydrate dehydratase / NAD(P)H-hydrate epimerase